MQPKENYQHVLVSKTLFKRLVSHHALCSECLMPANIHGGYVPCRGAHIIVDMEIINAVATKTTEPDGRPEYHFVINTPKRRLPGIDYENRILAIPIDPGEETRIRLWE